MDYTIRPARPDEFERLGAIERSAATRFATIGMDDIADGEPTPPEFVAAAAALGGAFVAATDDDDDVPVGFILIGLVDRAAHIYELSVSAEHGGRGLGRRLIDEASRFAGAEGVDAVTLSTFRDVAWNGPFYERIGFRYLEEAEWTPGMFLLRQNEELRDLPVERRAFMRWTAQ